MATLSLCACATGPTTVLRGRCGQSGGALYSIFAARLPVLRLRVALTASASPHLSPNRLGHSLRDVAAARPDVLGSLTTKSLSASRQASGSPPRSISGLSSAHRSRERAWSFRSAGAPALGEYSVHTWRLTAASVGGCDDCCVF